MCDQMKRYGSIGKRLPLQMKQGADFRLDIVLRMSETGELFDSTDYTARAHLVGRNTRIEFEATFPSKGILRLHLPSSETAKLKGSTLIGDGRGSYNWDCELVIGSDVIPAFYGDVSVFGDR